MPEPGALQEDDSQLIDKAQALLPILRKHMDSQAFHEALDEIWSLVRLGNGYVDRQAPWVLRKSDPARMATVLYVLAEAIRHLGILVQPFMPGASGQLLDQLAVAQDRRGFAALGGDSALAPGTVLPAPQGVFPRYVEAEEGAA